MGHHYTPQKYLEGFKDPKPTERPMIWQFDKKTGKSSYASIKNVANAPGFYTDQDEILLAREIEKPANPVLEKLRARAAISPAERDALVIYIATMLTRVPRLRDVREGIAPQALKESFDDYRQMIRRRAEAGALTEAEARDRIREADEFEQQCAMSRPSFVTEQIKRPWPTPSIVHVVASMAWRFLETNGPSFFVTSDDPGSFFHGFGLGHPKAELIFPISSEVALHAAWQDNPWKEVRPIKQWAVREFNRRIALGASRFVFAHECSEWLAEVIKNKPDQLSRIEW